MNESKFDKEKIAHAALEGTRRIIEAFPARLAGSTANKKTAELLKDELLTSCDDAHVEEFARRLNMDGALVVEILEVRIDITDGNGIVERIRVRVDLVFQHPLA